MFYACSGLTTIYVGSEWSTANVTESHDMFTGCTSLVGYQGTAFDGVHLDVEYAHLDGGTANPGYLTDKNATVWSVIGTINGNWDVDTRMESTDGIHYTAKFTGMNIGTYQFKVRANGGWDIQYPNNGDPSDAGTEPVSVAVELEDQSTITVMFNAETGVITTDVAGVYSVPGSHNSWDVASEEMVKGNDGIYSLSINNLTAGATYEYKIAVAHSWEINYGVDGQRDGANLTFTVPDGETSVTVYFDPVTKLTTANLPTGLVQAYVVQKDSLLTFYYDNRMEWVGGKAVGDGSILYQQIADHESFNRVVFDASVADYRPTSMHWWFLGCKNLVSIEGLEYLNTEDVTDMIDVFYDCNVLQSIDLSHFNTANVTNMQSLFGECHALTNIDVSTFNTENVTNMNFMFGGTSVRSLDLSNFNTAKVDNMRWMFSGVPLQTLDLSSFNTASVINMEGMFNGCDSLTTIFVGSGWSTGSVTNGSDMFTGCTSLVGGAGTTFDGSHVDATYAHIDGGPDNPGYLTLALSMGDANGDGSINIADAVATVTNILGQPTDGNFYKYAADINNDSFIDIFDVTMIVNAVFEAATPAPAFTRGNIDHVSAEAIRLMADAHHVYMGVEQAQQYTAFQFDIDLPEGTELADVRLSGNTDHQLSFVKRGESEYRVVALSMNNEVFRPTNGHLIQLQVSNMAGEDHVKVSNMLFVTPAGKTITGISDCLNATMTNDDAIYNLQGEKLGTNKHQLGKGIYIINHKKVIIK